MATEDQLLTLWAGVREEGKSVNDQLKFWSQEELEVLKDALSVLYQDLNDELAERNSL